MTLLVRSSTLPSERVDDGVVLVDAANDTFFSSNSVGAFIWERLASPVTRDQLCQAVVEACEDADYSTVKADVDEFIARLLEHKLITQQA